MKKQITYHIFDCKSPIYNQKHGPMVCIERVSTLFEFNSPISKKAGWILNDFGKKRIDLEGFRKDFERNIGNKGRNGNQHVYSEARLQIATVPKKYIFA